MGTPEQGSVTKQLKINHLPDGKSLMFDMSTGGRAPPMRVSVPITRGELGVLKSLASFLIPRLLSFDLAMENGMQPQPPPF